VYPSHLNKANCSALNSDAYSIEWNFTAMPLNAHTTGDTYTYNLKVQNNLEI